MENMLTKTSLKILHQLSLGENSLVDIASAIKKSDKQVYRECKRLSSLGYVELDRGKIVPAKLPVVSLLLQVLREHENVIDLFSGSGITVLVSLIEPKSIEKAITVTELKKSIIYRKIKQAEHIGLVSNKDGYVVNAKLWSKAMDLFVELDRIQRTIDARVPAGSEIFHKNDKEIVFSYCGEFDATKTAFSVYERYGIKLNLLINYYYLPKKKLTKEDILLHSIHIAEKSGIREKIFVALFYLKNKQLLKLSHPMLENINKVLKGEKISGYPSLSEIKSRGEVYDLRI